MSCFTHSTSLSIETTCSCKQDRKVRYWGQQFWQMERDISVPPTEMTRPVTVDHLQSWFRIFRSDQTEMVRSIWWTNRNFRTFGLNRKRPGYPMASEPSILYYIAFFTLQAFLISLKQKRYDTDAGENKCSLTMVLFPPLWVTATHLFGLLLV